MSTEDDFRLTNLVSSYGVGTRSYNRSAEKRELKRQRALSRTSRPQRDTKRAFGPKPPRPKPPRP